MNVGKMADKKDMVTPLYEQPKTLWDKTKEAPFVPIGVLGTFAMIAYGVMQYKNRGAMSTSVYLMQYRVRAQSVIVGAMTIGVTYSLLKDYFDPKPKRDD